VPAAGFGTRFLPATKTVPKPLLPVLDTPAIELIAEEAAQAGATRLILVISPGQDALWEYFQPQPELEEVLANRGKTEVLERVRRATSLIKVETAIQHQILGLGHAVSCAEPNLDDTDDPVAVLLPDDLVLPTGVLHRMANVRQRYGGSVLGAINVPRAQTSAYGVFDVQDTEDPDVKRVLGMVEKPPVDQAPSTLVSVGRYLLDRAVFPALHKITPGAGGEFQLTDAIALLIAEGHPVHIVVHRDSRHDLGNPQGLLRAAVDFALQDPDYGADLRAWLRARIEQP